MPSSRSLRRISLVQNMVTVVIASTLLYAGTVASSNTLRTSEDATDWSIQAEAIVDQQLAKMTEGRDCTNELEPRLVDNVLVRNVRATDGDTAVVREVSFDTAYAEAQSGKVVVLAYCS